MKNKCLVRSCSSLTYARGLCLRHYRRVLYRIKHNIPFDIENLKVRSQRPKGFGWTRQYPNATLLKKNREEKLRELNYTCQICGKKTKEIHHIDKTKYNHNKDNLFVVCHKCHFNRFHKNTPTRTIESLETNLCRMIS